MPKTINPIKKMIDQIILYANLSGMKKGDEEAFRAQMEEYITRHLGFLVLNSLDSKGLKEYEAMISADKAPSSAKLQNFFLEKVPDFEERLVKGMVEFLQDVMRSVRVA
jgi:hypothetical protein